MGSGGPDDRVYIFERLRNPRSLVFSADGRLLDTWGEGTFGHPHGIWMSPQETLYCTDRDTHTVTRWTPDGELLQTWGTPGQPGGPGEPFNEPTQAVVAANGDMFV